MTQKTDGGRVIRTAHINPNAAFGQAFEAARSKGCDFFVWRGSKYHTKTAEEITRDVEPIIMKIQEERQCPPSTKPK